MSDEMLKRKPVTQLPIVTAARTKPGRTIHYLRLLLIVSLLIGLHQLGAAQRSARPTASLQLADVQNFLPEATAIEASEISSAMWKVLDKNQRLIATAIMTSPQADEVVGYAGPSNLLLLLNDDGQVTRAGMLSSSDTVDHVLKVRESALFWQQFEGRTMGQSPAATVDGVSGATLTSLAMAEAIDLRLRGQRSSLRFPDELSLEEVMPLYSAAARLQPDVQRVGFFAVVDSQQRTLGHVIRTGPLESGVVGYQGPTEVIIAIDDQDVIQKVRLRNSFDNEPYVRYTRMEASFWAKFVGRSLRELSQIDVAAEGIEGVSGATMTSMAVVETLRRSAEKHLQSVIAQPTTDTPMAVLASVRKWNWSPGEIATLLLAILVVPWSLSSFRGQRWLRRVWQLAVLIIIVGISGNLLSIALLAGWTNSLPRLSLAPGLVALVVVALACPALLGRNVYCDHVCPHGIAQQWMARRAGRGRWSLRRLIPPVGVASSKSLVTHRWRVWLQRGLHASAVLILLLAMTWIVWRRPAQLTIFEPFDVYAWRVGLSSSLIVAVLSLLLAAKEPMGYCRLACPTGKVLDGIRLKRSGGRIAWSDMLLSLIAVLVWAAVWLNLSAAS